MLTAKKIEEICESTTEVKMNNSGFGSSFRSNASGFGSSFGSNASGFGSSFRSNASRFVSFGHNASRFGSFGRNASGFGSSFSFFDGQYMNALADALKRCNNLKTLDLSSNSIGVEGTKALAEALKNCTNLTTLDLSSNRIGVEGTKALAEALKSCTNLTTLNLSSNSIGVEGTKALAEALKNCTNLTTLDLSSNYICYEGTKALAEALKSCTNLTTLDLSSNSIGVEGTKALAEALKNCTNLTTLDLSSNSIGVEGTKALAEALKNCTNLTTLKLKHSGTLFGYCGPYIKTLAEALKSCTNLTTLDLSSNSIGVEGTKTLAEALKNCTNLTTLDFSSNRIGVEGTKALAEALKSCTNLTTLNLSSNRIDDEGTKALAEALKSCTNLTTLDLSSNYICYEGTKALAEALKSCTNLTTLDLSSNYICYEGTKALAEALKSCTNLTTLDLSSNSIGVEGTKALAEALKNCTNLTTLDLSSNSIGVEGTKALAEALKNCTNLTTLDLSSNSIGVEGTKALAEALKNCTNLTTLDLSSNYICYEGTKALAEALKSCTNLTTLDLSSNSIGVEGTKALAEALKNCTNLTTLDLSSNSIGVEGTKALAEALKNCTNLTTLDLSSNSIGVEGTKALAEALKNCTNLTTLDLSSNSIGVEGTKALAEALKNCTNLTTLDLSSNSIGVEGTKALAEALKNCTNLTTLKLKQSNKAFFSFHGLDMKALAEALANCTNLTTLDLSFNNIDAESTKALAEALKSCTNLTTLDLSSNGIGAEGIEALAKMLETCTNLTTLKLKHSHYPFFSFHGLDVKALAEALKSCTNLTTLDLSSNRIDDEGTKALAKGLKRCKNLKILHFDGNNVGFTGASFLAKTLHQTCPSVQIWCDLRDTQNSRRWPRDTKRNPISPKELFAKVCFFGEDVNSPDVDFQGLCLFGVATYIFPSGDKGNTNVPDTVSSSQRVAASSGFSFQEIEERVNINFVDTVPASQGPACTFGRRLQSNRRELKSTHAREPASPKSGLQQGAKASFSDVMQLAEEIAGFRNSLDKRRESARVALLEEFIGPAVQNYFGQVKLRQISGNMRRCKESLQNLQDQIRESTQVDLSSLIEARDAERELLRELLEDVHPWIREGSDGDGENTVREFKAKLASSIGYFNFGNVSATQNAAADDFKHCQELAARTDKCIQEYKLKLSGEGGTAEQRSKQAVENVIERVSQLGLDNAFRVALRTPEKATELQHELLELRKALQDELKVLKEDAVAAEALEILWAINSILCRVENLDGNTTNFEPGSIISREEFDAMYVSLRLGSIKPNLSTIEKIEKALAASRKAMNILKRAKHDLEEEETEDGRVYFRDRIAKQEEILSKGTPIELSKVYRHKLAEILQHAQEHYPELLKDEDWLERLHVSTEGVFEVACSDLWLANVEITDFQPVGEPLASRGGKTVQKVLDDNGNALVIKQFQLEHSGQSEKFYKQVANLGHVISQHVIHIQGAFIDMTPGVPPRGCIVMPFYEQGDLARWIQDYPDEGKTSRDRLATGLLLGVADLHDHGVVHCDIKPENIFLTRNGTPLIGDFDGIKVANRTVTYTSLQATPRYIAPELQDGPVDKFEPAMDMYSVGVVLDDLYPTERSTAMQTLIDSLTATAPGQRPSARQALRHSAFGVAEIPVESCLVCMEEKPLIESTSCEKGDFLCKDCIERAVEAGAKPQAHVIIAADGTMACMKPGCDGKISVQEVARLAPNALNNLLLIVKMKTEIAVATQAEQEIEKRVAELLKADGLARDIKQHLQHIQEKILNICCPNCGTCFVLFDGCCAVACSRDSCNNHFCAWCLEYSSTDSKDCHDHVTKCQKNLAQGRVFPNSFEQVQHAWQLLRAERLRSYWSTNIHDRILRSALLEQLAPLLTSDIVGAGFKLD